MEYTIERTEKGKWVVTIDGKEQRSVMGAIREFYRETGLKYDDTWTAKQIIVNLKKVLEAKKQTDTCECQLQDSALNNDNNRKLKNQ